MKKWELFILISGLSFCVFVYVTIITGLKRTSAEIEEALLLDGKLQKINWKWTYLPINLNVDDNISDLSELTAAITYLNQESRVRIGVDLFEISANNINAAYIQNYNGTYNHDKENLAGTIEKGINQRPTIYLFDSFNFSKIKKQIFIHELLHLIGFDHNMKEESIMYYHYHKKQNQLLTEQDWNIFKFVYSKEFESSKNIGK
jgi:hypothetical protein